MDLILAETASGIGQKVSRKYEVEWLEILSGLVGCVVQLIERRDSDQKVAGFRFDSLTSHASWSL